jgi:hypothetical protein
MTPETDEGAPRTFDLPPPPPRVLSAKAGDDVGGGRGGVTADQLLDVQLKIHSLTSERDTLTVQLLEANSTIFRLDASLRASPTQSTVQGMLMEANASSINVSRQRDALVQELQGAETRITELNRFLTNMQNMAAHVKTRYDETDRQRKSDNDECETLRTNTTRLTQRVADLTLVLAGRYTPAQHEEARRQTANEYETKLATQRAEMQASLTAKEAELTRYKGMYTKVHEEQMATAINTDASSSQAQFIRQLREKCELLANERDTNRRNADDYANQLSRADETCQAQSAEHQDTLAAARHVENGLKSQILAATEVNKQQAAENARLTSNVTQLREETNSQNAMVETLNQQVDLETKRNEEVEDHLRNACEIAKRNMQERPDPATQKEQVDRHASEMATAQTKYDHHLTELTAQLGQVQAENDQLWNDVGWYENYYQEPWPAQEEAPKEDRVDRVDLVDPAPLAKHPTATAAGPTATAAEPAANATEPTAAQAAVPSATSLRAEAPAFSPQETFMLELAKRLGTLDDEMDANGNEIPVRKELDSVKVPSYPTISTYRDWTTQLTRNVTTAANRFDDDAIPWLRATFDVDTTFDQFYECPKEFLTLDRKLAKSLVEIIPKYLKDRITNQETAYHMRGQQIKGRQILWMMSREFDVNTDLGFMYSIEDLSLMPFTSDKDLQGFLNKWDEISASIEMDKIKPATVAQMFQKKLLGSTILKSEVAVWRRLDKDHPDKTYQWLRDCIETHLRLDKEDRNQDGLQAAHRQTARQPRQVGSTQSIPKGGGEGGGQGKGGQGGEKGGKAKGGKSDNRTPGGRVHPSMIPCRYLWRLGCCNKQSGGTCPFDHRAPTEQEIVDYGFYARGKSPPKGGGKADAEGKGKTKTKPKGQGQGPCAQFFQNGTCRYGDNCIFSHTGSPPPKGGGKGGRAKGSGEAGGGEGKRAHAQNDWEQDAYAYYPDNGTQWWEPEAAMDEWPADE